MDKDMTLGLAIVLCTGFGLSSCAVQEQKTAAAAKPAPVVEAKAPLAEKALPAEKVASAKPEEAKAKPVKARGDVGLLDLEKNYMILVKEGKLITVNFDQKTKVTKVQPTESKMGDIGLGSSATVEYQIKDGKNIVNSLEYKAAKGGE
jgi:hypothetical protein